MEYIKYAYAGIGGPTRSGGTINAVSTAFANAPKPVAVNFTWNHKWEFGYDA